MDLDVERIESLICNKCGETIDATGTKPFSRVVCPKCEAKLSVPAKLGNLLLLKPIGKGSMGVVYRALDTTLRRTVAVKILKDVDKEDEDRAKACLTEARSLAALNHPNVVHVFTIGIERNQPYIVMELVDGGRLDSMIKKEGSVDEIRALELTIESAEGLRAALGEKLIHGDIKPANILMDRQGVAKLVDFGIARRVDDDEGHGFLGTPYYVAPEIVRKKRIDHRCDIFSLGATLFQALTGQQAFQGDTVKEVVKARLEGPAMNVRELDETIHPGTANVVAHMLESDPDERYQTYDDLISDLHDALAQARRGPVDPALADLGMAAVEAAPAAPALLPGASRTGFRGGTAKRITSKVLDEEGLGMGAIAMLLGGLGMLSIVLLVVLYFMFGGSGNNGGQTSGTDGDPNAGATIHEFTGPLPSSWETASNDGGFPNEGTYTLLCKDKTTTTLRRVIGEGDFESEVHITNIGWNSQISAKAWIGFIDIGDNKLIVEILKKQTNAPLLKVTNYRLGKPQKPREFTDAGDFKSINFRFVWIDSTSQMQIYYGTDGAAPDKMLLSVAAAYSPTSTKDRKIAIGVEPVEGNGEFSIDLDYYKHKGDKPK